VSGDWRLGEGEDVGGGDIETVNGDDFCSAGKVHHFCESDSDSQSCEAARAGGDIDLFDVTGFFAEVLKQRTDGGEKVCAVACWAGECCIGKKLLADCEGDRADSAGGLDGQDERGHYHLLFTIYNLLFTIYNLLFTIYNLLLLCQTVQLRYLVFTTFYWLTATLGPQHVRRNLWLFGF